MASSSWDFFLATASTSLIRFEAFQAITFTLAGSLFLFFLVSFLSWIVGSLKSKKRPLSAR